MATQCFKEVPEFFFQNEFSLANPRTFEEILNPHKSTGNSQQRKLSDYLDLTENALLQQIWSRSADIFSALNDIKGQQEHVSTAIATVNHLRTHLRELDSRSSAGALLIPLMHQRRENEARLHAKLQCMQRVLEGRSNVQTLLEGGDYLGALETLADCKETYITELQGITSMRKVGEQLDAFDSFVCEVISNRFVSCAIEWSMDETDSFSELEKLGAMDDAVVTEEAVGLSLGQLMHALLLIGRLPPAFSMYKSRLVEGLKLVVRACVSEYLGGSGGDASSSGTQEHGSVGATDSGGNEPFANRIRAMPVEHYLSSVLICFEHLLKALQRAHRVHQFMLTTFNSNDFQLAAVENERRAGKQHGGRTDSHGSEAEASKFVEGLRELSKSCLASACDIAQKALSQLMLMRKGDTARLPLSTMKCMWEAGSHFAIQIETMSGGASAYIVRQALQTLTSTFLSAIHEQAKLRLAAALEAERWIQCDATPEKQALIDRLASGKAFLKLPGGYSAGSSGTSTNNSSGTNNTTDQEKLDGELTTSGRPTTKNLKPKACPVIVDGVTFKVVWPALLSIELATEYLEVAMAYPPATGDVIPCLKDLLEQFNKTTQALVLGGGAQKSQAQLRSISAKHLTVAAQSLGLISAVLPHIRAALLTQLPPNRSMQLQQLDRTAHELLEHHSQILTKFVIILGDSIEASVHKLAGVDWDSSAGTHIEYFEDIARNVAALHRVLLLDAMLPIEQIHDVFSRIFSLILRKLPVHFDEIMPTTKTGKQRILDEVVHLTANFALLQNVNSTTEMTQLEETFRRKYTKDT